MLMMETARVEVEEGAAGDTMVMMMVEVKQTEIMTEMMVTVVQVDGD